MKKQTAVEWFIVNLPVDSDAMGRDWDDVREIIRQAKQMEKQQIEDAFNEGVDWNRDYFSKQKGMVKILPETYGDNNE